MTFTASRAVLTQLRSTAFFASQSASPSDYVFVKRSEVSFITLHQRLSLTSGDAKVGGWLNCIAQRRHDAMATIQGFSHRCEGNDETVLLQIDAPCRHRD